MLNLLTRYSPLLSAAIFAALLVGATDRIGSKLSDAIHTQAARITLASR